ncbi:hypothetical protein ACLOJK_008238 [Asimina triloba]
MARSGGSCCYGGGSSESGPLIMMEEERKVAASWAASLQSAWADIVDGSGESSGMVDGSMAGSTGMADAQWMAWIIPSKGLPATITMQMASSELTTRWVMVESRSENGMTLTAMEVGSSVTEETSGRLGLSDGVLPVGGYVDRDGCCRRRRGVVVVDGSGLGGWIDLVDSSVLRGFDPPIGPHGATAPAAAMAAALGEDSGAPYRCSAGISPLVLMQCDFLDF